MLTLGFSLGGKYLREHIVTMSKTNMKHRLVILGSGESGVGAALLGKQKGYDVFVSDGGKIKEIYKKELADNGIAFEEGGHTENLILNAFLHQRYINTSEKTLFTIDKLCNSHSNIHKTVQ